MGRANETRRRYASELPGILGTLTALAVRLAARFGYRRVRRLQVSGAEHASSTERIALDKRFGPLPDAGIEDQIRALATRLNDVQEQVNAVRRDLGNESTRREDAIRELRAAVDDVTALHSRELRRAMAGGLRIEAWGLGLAAFGTFVAAFG